MTIEKPVILTAKKLPRTLSSTGFICRSCRAALAHPTTHSIARRTILSDAFLKRTRERIWNTKNPPGLANPYGDSFIDRRRAQKQQLQDTNQHISEDAELEEEAEEEASSEIESYEPATPVPYRPATTWDGLEFVGHRGDWRDMEETEEDDYEPWARPRQEGAPLLSERDLTVALYEAILTVQSQPSQETPALQNKATKAEVRRLVQQYRRADISNPRAIISHDGYLHGFEVDSVLAEAKLRDPDEIVDVSGPSRNDTKMASAEADSNSELNYFSDSDSTEWLSLSLRLTDPNTLEILKTFTQLSSLPPFTFLTSAFLNHPSIRSHGRHDDAVRLDHIIKYAEQVQKPKPKTLYQKIVERGHLTRGGEKGMGNVMVMGRRETPVDKEKEVGRWKVIERELKERGLPVLGKAYG